MWIINWCMYNHKPAPRPTLALLQIKQKARKEILT